MIPFAHIASVLADHGQHEAGAWWFPFGLVWIVAGAALIWVLLRSTRSRNRTAEDVLAERFARGEIAADEYHERLSELRSHR